MTPNPPFFSDREVDNLYRVLNDNYVRLMEDCNSIIKVVEIHQKILNDFSKENTFTRMVRDFDCIIKAVENNQMNLAIFRKEIIGLLNSNPTFDDLKKQRKNWEGMR